MSGLPSRTDNEIKELLYSESVVTEKGCWELKRARDKFGYPRISYNNKSVLAHRLSYKLFNGPVNNMCVCHSCDNPGCVNPKHLWLGTHQDNMTDKVKKGRAKGR